MAKAGKPKGYPHTGGNNGVTRFWRPRWNMGVCIVFDPQTADYKAWLAGNISLCTHGATRGEALTRIEEILDWLIRDSDEEAETR